MVVPVFDSDGWHEMINRKINELPEVCTLQTSHGQIAATQWQLYGALARCKTAQDYVMLNTLVSNVVRNGYP